MAMRSNNTSTDSSSASQIAEGLKSTLSSADTTVNQGVQNLARVHQARLSQLSRTAAVLKAQYGADDAGVKAAEASAAAATTTAARISIVHQQLATPAVQVAKNGWALQGRVLDAQFQPAAKFTVFLVDANKTYLRQYGFAYTDDTGYFLLNYTGSSEQPAAESQIFVEVANTDTNPVYLSATPFQPVIGSASYQNIVLPADGQPIGDPPPEIRAEALPVKKLTTHNRAKPKKP